MTGMRAKLHHLVETAPGLLKPNKYNNRESRDGWMVYCLIGGLTITVFGG